MSEQGTTKDRVGFYRRLRNYYLACRWGIPALNLHGTSRWRAIKFAFRMAASEPPR